jgi:hypothetical protein
VQEFFQGFEPILVSYWENERTDFELLKDDRLIYQAETLHALLVRYAYQKHFHDGVIPMQRDIGMLKVDFKDIRKGILP